MAAAASQQGQGQGSGDNSLGLMWLMALVLLTGIVIWYELHAQIVGFIFKIKLWEAQFVSLFTSSTEVERAITYLKTVDPSSVSFDQFNDVSAAVGAFFSYPLAVLFLVMAFFLYRADTRSRYKKIYTMSSLFKQELSNWPQLTPIGKMDLLNTSINEGPWAMSMTPKAFAKKYDLLLIEAPEKNVFSHEGYKVTVLKNKAKEVFTLQLGAFWEGVERLSPHRRALFAIFIAKLNRDDKAAMAFAHQISRSTARGKFDFSGADALIKKYGETKLTQKIIQRHAYVLTVLAGVLQGAREDGVLPTSEFIWLKPIDRPLWYMLNSLGRQTPFVEVAGPFAHWLAEQQLRRKILSPMIDEAVTGLEMAISEIKYSEEEE
jgi:intracellular multiplication protein IcmP